MNVLLVHNKYGKISGEEIMIGRITNLLQEEGHHVTTYFRESIPYNANLFLKIFALFSGIYSFKAKREIKQLVQNLNIEILQFQNLYPFISPSFLPQVHGAVPIVMRCSNYRLICPNGLMLHEGKICEKCGNNKEWWCLFRNCEMSLLKSFGYFARGFISNRTNWLKDHVDCYVAQTIFQKNILVKYGFDQEKIEVIPNMVFFANNNGDYISTCTGQYVGFVGRISAEKGIAFLIAAARRLAPITFVCAGEVRNKDLTAHAPDNIKFVGHLKPEELDTFYKNSRFIVNCAQTYEGFPSIIIEAFSRGRTVVGPKVGGIPEIIDDEVNGLLYDMGDLDNFCMKILDLWGNDDKLKALSFSARRKVNAEYSPEKYYLRLLAAYSKAINRWSQL